MKFILFTVVLMLGLSSIAFGQYKKGSVEEKLIELDRAWTFAELKGDKKAAGALVADDFVGTAQRGEIQNKAEYIASVVPNADMVKADEHKVTVYGNTAIMTHRATVRGVRNMQFRGTHVWMKRGGKWLIVAHHGSPVSPPIGAEEESEKDSFEHRQSRVDDTSPVWFGRDRTTPAARNNAGCRLSFFKEGSWEDRSRC